MTRRGSLGILVATALAVAACGGGEGAAPTSTPSSTSVTTASSTTTETPTTTAPTTSTTDPADAVAPPELAWSSCGPGRECATVQLPLDYTDPARDSVPVWVMRLPATGDRLGSLFFNFGGPGASASEILPFFGVPSEVRAHYDLIGVDVRGTGSSVRLDCGLDPAELYAVDPTVEDQADRDALVETSRRYAQDCETKAGDLLPHVGTRDAARDMDRIRAALGDDAFNYVGFSYGSLIGQVYAELFPERVGRMILDAIVDPAPDSFEQIIEQAEGFELTLSRWAAGCPNRSTCPSEDPIASIGELLARSEAGIPSPSGRTLGPGEAHYGLAAALYTTSRWAKLDRGVRGALEGDGGELLDLADLYYSLVDFSVLYAVNCLESDGLDDVDEIFEVAEAANARAPHFGEAAVTDALRCAFWPTEPEPIGPIRAPGTPPILVVSTTGDPATPYENGVRVAQRLANGVLLTVNADDHSTTFQGNRCVDAVAIAFLVEGVVPPEGTEC